MSGSVTDCYPHLIDAFEHGASSGHPDTLCADYFYTSYNASRQCLTGATHRIQPQSLPDSVYQDYHAGVLTITVNKKDKQSSTEESLLPVVNTVPELTKIPFLQAPLGQQQQQQQLVKKCISLENQDISGITLSIPMSSARVGHRVVSGDFNGNGQLDVAISAPYYQHEKTGAVFVLNSANSMIPNRESAHVQHDIRNLSQVILEGNLAHGRFGWSMAVLDMNQDGIDDLAVSTPFQGHGRVDIYFGQANIGLLRQPSIRIQLQSHNLQGTVLAGIDVDHDGYKDLVIGCPLCSVGNQPQASICISLVDFLIEERPLFIYTYTYISE
jgi:glycosylphosphatidylinositol phospholipase D